MISKRRAEILMGVVVLSVLYLVSINVKGITASKSIDKEDAVIVLDAGHGGGSLRQ